MTTFPNDRSPVLKPNRFVIAALDRCGGRMLQTTLDGHPEIACGDELFSDADFPFARHDDPDGHLSGRLASLSGRVRGFRLLPFQPEQADDATRRRVREAAARLPGLRVIFLGRRNGLRLAVSRRIAGQTRQWRLRPSEERKVQSVTIQPPDLWREFRRQAAGYCALREAFADCPSVTLSYERLTADFEAAVAGVLAFLDVAPQPLRPATRKQNPEPLRALLSNYDKLQAEFADTPYAGCFDE